MIGSFYFTAYTLYLFLTASRLYGNKKSQATVDACQGELPTWRQSPCAAGYVMAVSAFPGPHPQKSNPLTAVREPLYAVKVFATIRVAF
ncbi:hypothetical protein CG427_16795 [Pantoea ananatis]|jgi:hypothetical protein|nr:hypothetical protein CG427_16795 [Pantoea ananatis]CCF11939.1 hypothetical protein PANA5342_pPANA10208 [Pantoea ananatis LMG 5342]